MKKTKENVRLLVETIVIREMEEDATKFNTEAYTEAYLAGEEYEPATESEEAVLSILEGALDNEFDRHQPTEKEKWEASAPKIPVKIGEKEYQTFIDQRGVQRFCGNSVITYMMSQDSGSGKFSLNTLIVEYYNGKFSSEDWLDFMTSYGYSVSGLCSLTEFTYLPVENPVWEHPEKYL